MIAYGNLSYRYRENHVSRCKVPHPRAFERGLLKPLAEICPGFVLPGLGTAAKLLDNLGDAADSVK